MEQGRAIITLKTSLPYRVVGGIKWKTLCPELPRGLLNEKDIIEEIDRVRTGFC